MIKVRRHKALTPEKISVCVANCSITQETDVLIMASQLRDKTYQGTSKSTEYQLRVGSKGVGR